MFPSLEGKVALVTGAARGQGRSHAVALASAGVTVVGVDLCRQITSVPYPLATVKDLDETRSLVEEAGCGGLFLEADVRDFPVLASVADDAFERFGRLDIVCANAGVASYAPLLEMSSEQWQDVMDV